ncbi:type IV toxin-antitoxin system AbiEi family antitoxin domain-containing protein [Nakamurella aerolata]|uniref:Transcriptional regulator, AbiEi antitoxin, Type IV TA system n=1 Tax=Nakamurella aerolata TaxID=1656892 RepID=A0A849A3L8_9ACTN|nr:hypothetical protein [Nakamurella aerolata]NNG35155.1 hypothetical protein [Nakamurella aerolata]
MTTANGLHTRTALLAQGVTDAEIKVHLRKGTLELVSRGTYRTVNSGAPWPVQQFIDRSLAAAHAAPKLILSHLSAAAVWGLPMARDANISRVHLTRIGSSGRRRQSGRLIHCANLLYDEVTILDTAVGTVAITSPERTILDVGRTESKLTAVTIGDAALHARLCSPDEVAEQLRRQSRQAGIPAARRALALLDGRAESPGETWVRVLFTEAGLPPSQSQVEVFDEAGRFVGRADGAITDAGLIWEYDGGGKYRELLRPGEDVTRAVLDEKNRQDQMTELGWLVMRIDKRDQAAPAQLVQRARRLVSSRVGLPRPRGFARPLPWNRILT